MVTNETRIAKIANSVTTQTNESMVTKPALPAADLVAMNNDVVTLQPLAGAAAVTTMMQKLQTVLVVYDTAISTLAELKQERDRLERLGLCNGAKFYRQLATGRALYANHGVGESCPMHGEPEGGGRLRKYVGQNGQAQLVLEAMERYRLWTGLGMDLQKWERRIKEIESLVDKAIRVNYEQLTLFDIL